MSWSVGGRELIWEGDPIHWAGRAPILFPVVGASSGGQVLVDGRAYPMPQHGFARLLDFAPIEHESDRVVLRLESSLETLQSFPFSFRLDVRLQIVTSAVRLRFRVSNLDARPMPFALGYHPAFPWPFHAPDRGGHFILFEADEDPSVPSITGAGLLDPTLRPTPLDGRRMPLSPELFDRGALVFRNARSRAIRFVSPSGAAITLEAEGCRHLALWTKPQAPFVSMEAWTGHADWDGATGQLSERDSMRVLDPGASSEVEMTLRWDDVAGGA
jgi:galactose mutarotase-like enzyme